MNFNGVFKNKRILITGHTGFKGAWLCSWLHQLGANVIGFSDQEYYLFSALNLATSIEHWSGDIRDLGRLKKCFETSKPELVIHLAAQALVSQGYQESRLTMETNILGTINLLECCLAFSPKALLIVTSDKVYAPNFVARNENAPLGGICPYSSSKSAVEIVVLGYQKLLSRTSIATARAGNVLGVGDRGKDRLLTDIIQAWENKNTVRIRFPEATRPWQHVLDCLHGYLLLAEKLLQGQAQGAWNFAPQESFSVQAFIDVVQTFDFVDIKFEIVENQIQENLFLQLDSGKARQLLGWNPKYSFREILELVFRDEFQLKQMMSSQQLREMISNRIDAFSNKK